MELLKKVLLGLLGLALLTGWVSLLVIGSIALSGNFDGLEPIEGAVMVLVALFSGGIYHSDSSEDKRIKYEREEQENGKRK